MPCSELVFGDNKHREEKRRIAELQEIKVKKRKDDEDNPYALLGEQEQLIESLTPICID